MLIKLTIRNNSFIFVNLGQITYIKDLGDFTIVRMAGNVDLEVQESAEQIASLFSGQLQSLVEAKNG